MYIKQTFYQDRLGTNIGKSTQKSTVFPQAFALVVPVLALFAMKIQNYYRRTSRELKRLASIARSPMYLGLLRRTFSTFL